jgi:hypothetical protein
MNNGLFGLPKRGPDALVRISEVITRNSQSSVLFTAIPAWYRDLEIVVRGRATDGAANSSFVRVQYNGDTGANYCWARNGSVTSGDTFQDGGFNDTSAVIGAIPAGLSLANVAGVAHALIVDYRGTAFFKASVGQGSGTGTNGAANNSIYQQSNGSIWRSTAPITAVRVIPGVTTFVDGSVVTLYGRT